MRVFFHFGITLLLKVSEHHFLSQLDCDDYSYPQSQLIPAHGLLALHSKAFSSIELVKTRRWDWGEKKDGEKVMILESGWKIFCFRLIKNIQSLAKKSLFLNQSTNWALSFLPFSSLWHFLRPIILPIIHLILFANPFVPCPTTYPNARRFSISPWNVSINPGHPFYTTLIVSVWVNQAAFMT